MSYTNPPLIQNNWLNMRSFIPIMLMGVVTISAPTSATLNKNIFNSTQDSTFAGGEGSFLPVDQAFAFNHYQQDNSLTLDWQVRDGYYLYQEKISVAGKNVTIGKLQMVDGTPHKDEFFGDVHIYKAPLFAEVPLIKWQKGAKISVQFQGCAEAGFCYPPETREIKIGEFESAPDEIVSTKKVTESKIEPPKLVTKQQSIADNLGTKWWTPLMFFLLGVGLAFTPCVLPMYPILTSIVLGNGKLSLRRAFTLSFIYVQGMALTYTLLGLLVASAGMQFQAAMQHPYVLIGLSFVFIILSMSMFGIYSLQLPSNIQTKLNHISNKQSGGSYVGVFSMGAISGLVCSPCTTAPLSGALLYVAQSGDLLTGGMTLYALAIGMGVPLMIVTTFGNKFLPRTGVWMIQVKVLFGFILLAAPIFLLERILPSYLISLMWSSLGIATFGWLYHIKSRFEFGGLKQSVLGIVSIIGLFVSTQQLINQVTGVESAQVKSTEVIFKKVASIEELDEQLLIAKKSGKKVMLDFYADWCVACKEYEKYTFNEPSIITTLEEFTLLQVDVTKNRPEEIELLKKMGVLGLPTIDFWDERGEQIEGARLTGFLEAGPFSEHLKSL